MNKTEMPKDYRGIARIMRSPFLWGEQYLANRDGKPRRYWPHQSDDLDSLARNTIHLDGRDTGKTVDIATLALHHAFVNHGGSVLVAVPHQGPLDTIVEEVEYQIETSDDLKASIAVNAQGRQKITRKPYFKIEFTTGSIIYFRPAGAYGDPFRSLHVDLILVDEAAWLSEKAWKALRQCLVAGGRMKIYSTPNGLRDTTYYRLTHSKKWKVFRWPSWLNPAWTKEREEELVEFYGGRDTAGWQHEVAGEHGRPSYGAFNLEYLTLCRRDIPEYVTVVITGEELKDCENEDAVKQVADSGDAGEDISSISCKGGSEQMDDETKNQEPGTEEADAAKKKDSGGADKDVRIKELEEENRVMKSKLDETQKELEKIRSEQQAAARRTRAEKLLQDMVNRGIEIAEDERETELKRLAGLSDDAFEATEAAVKRVKKKEEKPEDDPDALDEEEEKDKKKDKKKPPRKKASNGGGMNADADLRPFDIDDNQKSLEKKLKSGFMAAYEDRIGSTG